MQYRNPEETRGAQTAEGEICSDFLPPCPAIFKSRRVKSLWAQATAKLSRKGKMSNSGILKLEAVFIRNGGDSEGLEKAVTRYVQRNV